MAEQVDVNADIDLLEGFNPERGGTREQIAAYVVGGIEERLKENKGQMTGLSPHTNLTVSARSPDRKHRGAARETSLPQFPAGEIERQRQAMIGVMETHTRGDGRFIVNGEVLVSTAAGRADQTQELFNLPIAKEETGLEILERIRGGNF